jgi:hypothetical protein
MHVYGNLLTSYAERSLPEPTLAALDAHVSNCLFCAHALADEAVTTTHWERRGLLGRLVRVEREEEAVASLSEDRERRAA